MIRKQHPILRSALVLLFALKSIFLLAQDKSQTWEPKKDGDLWKEDRWELRFSMGINSFQTNGIPMSRNQINLIQSNPANGLSYKQESGTAGFCYEARLGYRPFKQARIALLVNFFKDDEAYLFSDGKQHNAASIEEDSLKGLSIGNMQSYANMGLSYEHDIYQTRSGKHVLSAGLAFGLSINRTPDRTEYDYFEPENFVPADTVGSEIWYMTYTHFNDGFFLSPSLSYARKFNNKHALLFSISPFFQWHSTSRGVQIPQKSSGGTRGNDSYTLQSIQIKIGYSF